MAERRQVHRREPIEVQLVSGEVVLARPLPWLTRNDLGDLIVKEHTDAINNLTRLFVTSVNVGGTEVEVPQMEAGFQQKIRNWTPILQMAYPDQLDLEKLGTLLFDECVELTLASLEINHLEQLKDLVDPNSQSPMIPGGISSPEAVGEEAGPKTTSSVDSSSSGSDETTSSSSPSEKSSPSSGSTTDSASTTSDGS